MSEQSLDIAISLLMKASCPVLLIFGTFGNIMTIIVFRRLKDYSGMSTYYIALAMADMGMLYFGWTTRYWLQHQFHFFTTCLHTITCKVVTAADYTSSALSSWYLVAMTIQRAMSVVWPHRVNVLCTRKASCATTAVITVVIVVSYSHILYGYSMQAPNCQNSSCAICHCQTFSTNYYFFERYFLPWIDLILACLAPFALLLVSNTVLVRAVLTSARNARLRLAGGQSMHVTARETKASSLSMMLIVLSVTFFILTGPLRVYMLLYPYVTFIKENTPTDLTFSVLYIQCAANNAVNFYLYCLTGAKFRHELANLFRVLFHKIKQK